ncbi:MFS transporter [Streptomyces sp. NPDC050388]|uniref:MFS transporter n=1 Tax=Streptomyces sp. NPDC050388 TaxID=3155781 RepID=UPI00343FC7F1
MSQRDTAVPGRQRAFWTYYLASTASDIGSAVRALALPLVAVLVLDATPLEVALVTGAGFAAWLLIGLPAGDLVARLPLRGAQVATDLLRALCILSLPAAWAFDVLSVAQVALVAFLIGLADVVYDVANSTFMPAVVPREDLLRRNTLMTGTQAVTTLGGPSFGGVLVQLAGAVPALLIDAVSYIVSALLLRTLPERPPAKQHTEGEGMGKRIAAGWTYVVSHPVMAPFMWASAAVNFAAGAQLTLYPILLARSLDVPPALIGVLLAGEGAGVLIASTVATRIVDRLGTSRSSLVGGVGVVVGTVVVAAAVQWPPHDLVFYGGFLLGNALCGGSAVFVAVNSRTFVQSTCPAEFLSRVTATMRFVTWGVIPAGGMLAALLVTRLGTTETLWCVALAAVAVPVILARGGIGRTRDLAEAQ